MKLLSQKWVAHCLISSLVLSCAGMVTAKEPTNIVVTKEALIRYYDSGQYMQDVQSAANEAETYLRTRLTSSTLANKKPAIVFDIDETVLSNYPDMRARDFGGSLEQIIAEMDKGRDQALPPMLKLYRYAKANHIAIFFLTGRSEEERNSTVRNLKTVGYDQWAQLFLRSPETKKLSASAYKTAIRKKITDEGYHIVLNMGDQHSDLVGGYADKTIKLPNPYYFIP